MTDLFMIRHGEAVVNVQPIIGGMRGDTGLTDRGRAQAVRLEQRLRQGEIRADVLYSSTLPRALETATYVSRGLNMPALPCDDIQELRPGVADGMSVADYEQRYGWPDWDRDPYRPLSPEGESWADFLVRSGRIVASLTRQHPEQTIVLVTHGGIIDATFLNFFGLNAIVTQRVGFYTMNTSITQWRYGSMHGLPNSERWSLVRYNDTAHLIGIDDAPAAAVPLPVQSDEQR